MDSGAKETSEGASESDVAPAPAPKPTKKKKKGQGARRSPRNIKTAARLLQKEARRIIKRHARRLAPEIIEAMRESIAAIDVHRGAESWSDLEAAAERLDELLHEHASFARKSALRETIENIAIAVVVALGLRSCFYEPFKIPSGSMMPTLLAGDHIFVNKYAYGVQVPLTTTVVAEDWLATIARGDVVVFRYPLDTSEDFIKRVIGLPGDTIRVENDRVYIKRAGASEFEKLARKRLSEPCLDDSGTEIVESCTLYEETVDEKTYLVRYFDAGDPKLVDHVREIEVPEGHYLVMGDNRKMSHDSLQWVATVEAVAADGLLSVKDLRDLTSERLFTLRHPLETKGNGDANIDHVIYLADHQAPDNAIELEVWRDPVLGTVPVFEALADRAGADPQTLAELVEAANIDAADRDAILGTASVVTHLSMASSPDATDLVFARDDTKTVFRLRCGTTACSNTGVAVRRMVDVLERFATDHDLDARDLIEGDANVRYSQQWKPRDDIDGRYHEAQFHAAGKAEEAGRLVRVRLWRKPGEGIDVLRNAALRAFEATVDSAEGIGDLGDDAWLVERDQTRVFVIADGAAEVLAVLECGEKQCPDRASALKLATTVAKRLPAVADNPERMHEVLTKLDVGELAATPVRRPDQYPWDKLSLSGSVRGGEHSVSLELARRPEQGVDALVQRWKSTMVHPVELQGFGAGGFVSETAQGIEHVFHVPQTETVIRIVCAPGLCPERKVADAIATRVAEKALDTANFVDAEARRPRPFVPRGHVKGRAERIWYPFSRFWLSIR